MTDANNPSTQPQKPLRRWLWPVLITSLALNLFIIGAAVGSKFFGRHGWHHKHGGLHAVMRDMLPEQKQKVRDALCASKEDREKRRAQMRERRDAIRELLAQEPLDAAALTQKFEDIIETRSQTRKAALPNLIEVVKMAKPEHRKRLVRALMRPRGHKHRRHLCR